MQTPLDKVNLAFPLQLSAQGFKRVTRVERYSAAVFHLMSTPLGSYFVRPSYGTLFHLLRTQGMNPTTVNSTTSQFQMAVRRWIPDIILADVPIDRDGENQLLTIKAVWVIRAADPNLHGDLAKQQVTTVSY